MYKLPSTVNDHSSLKKIQKNRRLLSLDHSYLNEHENEPKNKPNIQTLTLNHILSEICAYFVDVPRSRSTTNNIICILLRNGPECALE